MQFNESCWLLLYFGEFDVASILGIVMYLRCEFRDTHRHVESCNVDTRADSLVEGDGMRCYLSRRGAWSNTREFRRGRCEIFLPECEHELYQVAGYLQILANSPTVMWWYEVRVTCHNSANMEVFLYCDSSCKILAWFRTVPADVPGETRMRPVSRTGTVLYRFDAARVSSIPGRRLSRNCLFYV